MAKKKVRKYPVGQVLMLSNAHMPQHATVDLAAFKPLRASETDYGWVAWVIEDVPLLELESWFRPIVELALKLNCMLIEFDADNETIEGLETFQW